MSNSPKLITHIGQLLAVLVLYLVKLVRIFEENSGKRQLRKYVGNQGRY